MQQNDTIFALSTAMGKAGVAVIRVSGANISNLCTLWKGSLPPARQASLRYIYTTDNLLIDNALVVYFPAPHSFTGEDVLEFHTHGSPAIIQMLLQTLYNIDGLRHAEAGEFTRRALENGKMDLSQVEALADLLNAESLAQQQMALQQLRGGLSDFCNHLRRQILQCLATIEAYLDFSDEDLPDNAVTQIMHQLNAIISNIDSALRRCSNSEKIRSGLHVAIIGPTNAGKSSLLNWFANRDVAITSDIEGTTRDVLSVECLIGTMKITLQDTAGLRNSTCPLEQEGMRRSYNTAEQADIRICMMDASNPLADSHPVLALLQNHDLVICNKIDKIPPPIHTYTKESIGVSVLKGLNMHIIEDRLVQFATSFWQPDSTILLTRERHKSIFSSVYQSCIQAQDTTEWEIKAEFLRQACSSLSQITGSMGVEDMLDSLFNEFCIGK